MICARSGEEVKGKVKELRERLGSRAGRLPARFFFLLLTHYTSAFETHITYILRGNKQKSCYNIKKSVNMMQKIFSDCGIGESFFLKMR